MGCMRHATGAELHRPGLNRKKEGWRLTARNLWNGPNPAAYARTSSRFERLGAEGRGSLKMANFIVSSLRQTVATGCCPGGGGWR